MTKTPKFDLYYADGLALLDLPKTLNLAAFPPSEQSKEMYLKLSRAVEDINRLKNGWRPSLLDLADAPLLTSWSFSGDMSAGGTHLAGIVIGHPRFRSGTFCHTSVLVAIDTLNWKWARSVSRFYRIQTRAIEDGGPTR
jgi:hypothetical protein